jgi:hypothetical protein
MNRVIQHDAAPAGASQAAPDGGLYARWRTGPQYRLVNLAGDPAAWLSIDLDLLELLVFDQCLVFGAAYAGGPAALGRAARRDAVVRQSRDTLWAAYRAYTKRAAVSRRRRLLHDVAEAAAAGAGSIGSLLPFGACDMEAAIVSAAATARARLASRPEPPSPEHLMAAAEPAHNRA